MLSIKKAGDLIKAVRWAEAQRKQFKFSVSQAINATSKGLKLIPESKDKSILSDIRRHSEQKLDRPKKQFSTGWFATTAKKDNLRSLISPKDLPFDRDKYVKGLVKGGDRPSKWIENTARKLGNLPSNIDLVPTRQTPRDIYGNPKRGFVKKHFDKVSEGKTIIGKPKGRDSIGIYIIKGTTRKKQKLNALFVNRSTTSYPNLFANLEKKAMARANHSLPKYFLIRQEANVKANL